ncbi:MULTISPECIES: hypothetical protein [unclassified Streptomyces]|uniref:hypothetical protein n=1 Tax=unclassified Streptomyces TaxID=2593676 RepID=UPI0001C1C6B7|nr:MULTISPECIES: hypothetical protein [unclassified Streptomyces]AEN13068.1 conserved hypothetical protein [Streptomyces sp. SirexAA-E]MYR67324.1 hypothetical protein [Streptomyces sp. SID4939]MYS00689.1 hypothetical protein [Streptomyces sp. SID4940]MYT67480.1 hypothetical protein [Streptomyces sp. SID8357]MYT87834.1 hypothetical protein [Streptomyces sp. SID8360]
MRKICIVGNSVAASRTPAESPLAGWGQYLAEFFTDQWEVKNYARDAMTARDYYPGRFVALLNMLKPGDVVAVDFGGVEQRINMVIRYHSHREFREYLRLYVEGIRTQNAVPVLVTPAARCTFDVDGNVLDTRDGYPDVVRQVAAETESPLVDLNALTTDFLRGLGPTRAKQFFRWVDAGEHPNHPEGIIDASHFNEAGAREVAKMFASALHTLPGLPEDLVRPETLVPAVYPPVLPEFTVENPDYALYATERTGAAPAIAKPDRAALVGASPKFSGTVHPGTDYVLFFANGVYAGGTGVGPDGTWKWRRAVQWPEGDHLLQAVGLTQHGVSPAAELPFTVLDRIAPPRVNGPAEGAWSGPRPRFSGTAPKGVRKVMVLEGERMIAEAPVRDDGTWNVTHPHDWRPGLHTVEFVSVFSAIHSEPARRTFRVLGVPDGNWLRESAGSRLPCGGDACEHHPFAGP